MRKQAEIQYIFKFRVGVGPIELIINGYDDNFYYID